MDDSDRSPAALRSSDEMMSNVRPILSSLPSIMLMPLNVAAVVIALIWLRASSMAAWIRSRPVDRLEACVTFSLIVLSCSETSVAAEDATPSVEAPRDRFSRTCRKPATSLRRRREIP